MRSQVLISDKSSNDYVFAIFNPGSRYKNHPTTVVFLCFLFAHVKKSLYFCRGIDMKRWGYIVFLLLAGMVGQGCSSRAIHEAEAVVAQADSLWQAEMLYYSESGIRNFKNRTAKKLGTNSIEMRNALLKLAISEYSNAANNEIVHAQKH